MADLKKKLEDKVEQLKDDVIEKVDGVIGKALDVITPEPPPVVGHAPAIPATNIQYNGPKFTTDRVLLSNVPENIERGLVKFNLGTDSITTTVEKWDKAVVEEKFQLGK